MARAKDGAIVMTTNEVIDLGKRILAMTTTDVAYVSITHTASGFTRVANGRILSGDDGSALSIGLTLQTGKKPSIFLELDQSDEQTLRSAISYAESLARAQIGESVNLENIPYGPQQYLGTKLWYDDTAVALDGARHEVVPTMIGIVEKSGLEGAGFVGGIARTQATLRNDGLIAVSRETDIECTVTARAFDNTASGWAGTAVRNWSRLDPIKVATRAVEISKRASNPVAFEPGRRTVILTSAAVAQFMRLMAYAYDAVATRQGRTPFTKSYTMGGTKVGLRVFDPRLQFGSDPTDADGGYAPFFVEDPFYGIPIQPITWVEKGILKTLAYGVTEGLARGRKSHMIPEMVRMQPVPGTVTMGLDEMITNCKEGVFINRVSGLRLLDQRTGMMSGVTRDGCFLVRNGKIDRAIKNFRFIDSPFFFLNSIEAIGVPERAAFGHIDDDRWPLPPVIVPPLMVRDFNLSSLSDAI